LQTPRRYAEAGFVTETEGAGYGWTYLLGFGYTSVGSPAGFLSGGKATHSSKSYAVVREEPDPRQELIDR